MTDTHRRFTTCIIHDEVTGLVSDRFVSVGMVEGNVRLCMWYR